MKIDITLSLIFIMLTALVSANNSLIEKSFVRLDDIKSEPISNYKAHVYVTQNCSACEAQLFELKQCSSIQPVAIYFEGEEEKLRRYVRKKKKNVAVFLLDADLKKYLGFKNTSPQISLLQAGQLMSLSPGLKKCSLLEEHLRK